MRSGSTITLYVDGFPIASSTGAVTGIISPESPLVIGQVSPTFSGVDREFFNGLIDEVEIFNRALCAAEIKAIFDAGSAGKCKVDHFLCYKAKTTKETPEFVPPPAVTLTDQFETGSFEVIKPVSLCNPAEKTFEANTEPINDPNTHLKGYQIKPETAHVPRTNIKIENQFHPSRGELFVDTIKPDRLLVPTAKSLTGPVEPLDPVNIDHFKCYKVKVSKGQPKFEPILGVKVDDQFTDGDKLFDLKKPTRLCTPVDKDGSGIKNDKAHLMCYQAKPAAGQPKHIPVTGIFVNNQFGPEQLDTIKEEELCVPSEKILP